MIDRRSVLRRGTGALGAASLTSAAGCLFGDDGNGSSAGGDGDFLGVLPDPRPAIAPSFHAAYSYDSVVLRDELGADPMPKLAGDLLAIVGEMDGTAVADVDRLSGQTAQQVGHVGDVSFPSPNGTDLVVEGTVDVDGAAEWLASQDALSNLGDAEGYRRFGNGDQVVEAFTASEATLTFGNRRVTEVDASALANAAIEGIDDGFDAGDYPSSDLHATVGALPDGAARAATAFDLVAEQPDTGTDAYDEAAASLLAAGIAADVGGDTTAVTRVLRYRPDRVGGVDAVQSATEAAVADEQFAAGDWTVSRSGRSVCIEGSVSTTTLRNRPELLRRAVPAPAYDDLTAPIDPQGLGRDPPPRVAWSASQLDDGTVEIAHGGGPEVDSLSVEYVVDGERISEDWPGSVTSEDRFETASPPDQGTTLDLVWASGTANETILLRVTLPG